MSPLNLFGSEYRLIQIELLKNCFPFVKAQNDATDARKNLYPCFLFLCKNGNNARDSESSHDRSLMNFITSMSERALAAFDDVTPEGCYKYGGTTIEGSGMNHRDFLSGHQPRTLTSYIYSTLNVFLK